MRTSLSISELCSYTTSQVNNIFPDMRPIDLCQYSLSVKLALERLEYSFSHSSLNHYCMEGQAQFNHLFSDQYACFLWFLANTIWSELDDDDEPILNKLFFLNKALHGIEVMFNTSLPNIFMFSHTSGTILGRAQYADYFVASGGCVVGQNKSIYPVFGKGVTLAVGASVIGKCQIGEGSSIGVNTQIYQHDIPACSVVYTDSQFGLIVKPGDQPYACKFFKTYWGCTQQNDK